jgi:cobalamin biosynthesis Mg chelatase CobN
MITITVLDARRNAALSAQMQAANQDDAAGYSNAVEQASQSGQMVNSLNTKLAASGYTGNMPTGTTATSTTSKNDSGGSSSNTVVIVAICVTVGAVVLVAVGLVVYWQIRGKEPATDQVDIQEPTHKAQRLDEGAVGVDGKHVVLDVPSTGAAI